MRSTQRIATAGRWAVAAWLAVASASHAASVDRTASLEVGQAAPALVLTASDGTELSLEGIRGETNVVLVFYRGTW